MRRVFLSLLLLASAPARADTISAYAVSACGGQTLVAGQAFPLTVDLTGKLCGSAASTGSTGLDYSANKPTTPNVGANFGTTGVYANYVLIATVPANPSRFSIDVENTSGSAVRLIRAQYPQTPVIILGQWASSTGPNAACLASENAAAAAYAQLNDPNIWFVPVSTDANGPWIFGTGYTGATNNSGNGDVMVAPDGAHPTQLGCYSYAQQIAAKFANVISLIP